MQIRSPEERSRVNSLIDDLEVDLERLVGARKLLPEMLLGAYAKLDELGFIVRRREDVLSIADFEV